MYCYVGSRSPPFGDGQKSRYSFSVKMEVIIMKKFFRCIFNTALGIMFVTACGLFRFHGAGNPNRSCCFHKGGEVIS